RAISIIDKSRYAADYTYDLGTGMNTLNAQVVTQSANLSFQYYSGGTFKICQTVANFCKTETVCKEVFIDAPRLKAGKSLPTFQFKEDEPLKVVVPDLNDYFEDIGGRTLTFTFIPTKNTLFKGRIDNNKTFVLAPQEDVFGTNLIGFLTMKGGGLETDFPFNVVVTPLPDPPKRRKDSTLPKQITIFEDSPPTTISSYLEQHYYDPDNEAFSFIRTFSDTSGLIPELSYNPTTRRTTFSLRLAPDYYGKGRIFLEMNDSISNPTNFLVGYDTIHVEVKQTLDPPVLIKSIPNATLSQGFGQRVWVENLDDHFRDADGDPLTYSASTDNSAVQLRVDNKRLIISANSTFIGSAIGRVSASDGLITVSTTFNINIIDGGGVPIINLQTVTFCASSSHTVNLREYIFDNNTPFDGLKISTRVTSTSPNTVSVNTLLITIQNGVATFTSLSRDNATYSVEFSVKDSENKTGTGMVSVVVRGASITQLNATTLQASQGERYQWYNANGQAIEGATQRTFTISGSPTGVSVEVTQGSCKVRSSPFGLSVGLEDDLREENITLYPNPTNREVTLMLDGFYTGRLSIGIYDLTGRLWWEENIHKLANQFTRIYSLEYLPSGIYTLLIRAENSHIVRKLVKQ
ncbi:MAG: T9SS type A sorting domain-containing protein, partial [Flammeovirgaceae bacterium]|nr:T9SS type A sorting domain-containing protein [Flammeovirgaceae bacterium]MDW8287319.1 T9SS type A sorting domain-containing protein [Flammeovirgaceae bacterium]